MSKLNIIRDICDSSDVLFLQETWAMPADLTEFNCVSEQHNSYAISAVDPGELLCGRPYGGLTIIWRKSIDHLCRIVTFDDNRMLGLMVDFPGNPILFINVYLPYYSEHNVDDYIFYVGKVMSIIDELEGCGVMVFGDFNACVGGTYYQQWVSACEEYELTFSDVTHLPATSYTHVNNCSLSRSWLDHCLTSQTVHSCIADVSIDYNYHGSVHFPILVDLRIPSIQSVQIVECDSYRVKWDFSDDPKTDRFYNLIRERLAASDLNHHCFREKCTVNSHCKWVDCMWTEFTNVI